MFVVFTLKDKSLNAGKVKYSLNASGSFLDITNLFICSRYY